MIARLASIQKRFAGKPLAILALHDSSLSSRTELRDALGPLRNQTAGAIPIRFLLDRAPAVRAVGTSWVEFGSGRTAEIYGNRANETMCVIARDGNLVFVTGHSCHQDRLFAIAKDRHFGLSDEFNPDEPELKTEWQVGSLLTAARGSAWIAEFGSCEAETHGAGSGRAEACRRGRERANSVPSACVSKKPIGAGMIRGPAHTTLQVPIESTVRRVSAARP